MDPGQLVRAVRRDMGLSQRELAQRVAVASSVISGIESGRHKPRAETLDRILAPLGYELAPVRRRRDAVELLWRWLTLSTTQRLYLTLGGRHLARYDSRPAVWRALQETQRGVVVLPASVSAGVWLPGVAPPLPLPILVGPRRGPALDLEHLDPVYGPWRCDGLVPVGVAPHHEVLVQPPDSPDLVADPVHGPRLLTAAAMLHDEMRRDEAGRRTMAHRDSDPHREHGYLMGRRRFDASKPWPDVRDRRDWRLLGEPSFRDWLARRGHQLRDRPDL